MNIWDIYAPFYQRAMRADEKYFDRMYKRAALTVAGADVLELAAGPGAFSKSIAGAAKTVVATDFSEKMIAEAKKGERPENLTFEVADACALPYPDAAFGAVIISNALHVMPAPERALGEISRVLAPGGTLIAPNFLHDGSLKVRLRALVFRLGGVRFLKTWDETEYLRFMEKNGWRAEYTELLPARIPLLYAEFKKDP